MVKKEMGKKNNNSEVALNRPARRAESSADIILHMLKNKVKLVILRPVCFTKAQKSTF